MLFLLAFAQLADKHDNSIVASSHHRKVCDDVAGDLFKRINLGILADDAASDEALHIVPHTNPPIFVTLGTQGTKQSQMSRK